jgi:hypothetical protein
VTLGELGHIELDEGIFTAKKEQSQRFGASFCPTTDLCSSSSIFSRRSDSSVAICITGTPVHMETTSAMSSAVTTGLLARSQEERISVSFCSVTDSDSSNCLASSSRPSSTARA